MHELAHAVSRLAIFKTNLPHSNLGVFGLTNMVLNLYRRKWRPLQLDPRKAHRFLVRLRTNSLKNKTSSTSGATAGVNEAGPQLRNTQDLVHRKSESLQVMPTKPRGASFRRAVILRKLQQRISPTEHQFRLTRI